MLDKCSNCFEKLSEHALIVCKGVNKFGICSSCLDGISVGKIVFDLGKNGELVYNQYVALEMKKTPHPNKIDRQIEMLFTD